MASERCLLPSCLVLSVEPSDDCPYFVVFWMQPFPLPPYPSLPIPPSLSLSHTSYITYHSPNFPPRHQRRRFFPLRRLCTLLLDRIFYLTTHP